MLYVTTNTLMMQKMVIPHCSERNVDHTIFKGSLADDKCFFPM